MHPTQTTSHLGSKHPRAQALMAEALKMQRQEWFFFYSVDSPLLWSLMRYVSQLPHLYVLQKDYHTLHQYFCICMSVCLWLLGCQRGGVVVIQGGILWV